MSQWSHSSLGNDNKKKPRQCQRFSLHSWFRSAPNTHEESSETNFIASFTTTPRGALSPALTSGPWLATSLISPGSDTASSDTASSDTASPPPATRTWPGKVLCFLEWGDTAQLTGEQLLSHVSLSSSAAASPLPQGERDEKGAVG